MRYTLEALIVTKLLNIENDYFLKVTFSIYEQQINQVRSIIKRLEKELIVLKEYSEKCSVKKEKNKQQYANNSEKLAVENEKVFQNYKKLAQENINISFNKLGEYGFDVLITRLTKDIEEYKKKLEEYKSLKFAKYKQLAKTGWIKEYFGERVPATQIPKELQDPRNWREKAKAVKLDDEYELNYEFTSSLLHFTSYSLFTPNVASEEEINYTCFLINQYIREIISNIRKFSKVFIFDVFEENKIQ